MRHLAEFSICVLNNQSEYWSMCFTKEQLGRAASTFTMSNKVPTRKWFRFLNFTHWGSTQPMRGVLPPAAPFLKNMCINPKNAACAVILFLFWSLCDKVSCSQRKPGSVCMCVCTFMFIMVGLASSLCSPRQSAGLTVSHHVALMAPCCSSALSTDPRHRTQPHPQQLKHFRHRKAFKKIMNYRYNHFIHHTDWCKTGVSELKLYQSPFPTLAAQVMVMSVTLQNKDIAM